MTILADRLDNLEVDKERDYLKGLLEKTATEFLPLDKMVSQGGRIDEQDIEVSILMAIDNAQDVQLKLAVFFTEIVINCSCADDPEERVHGYQEFFLVIDKQTNAIAVNTITGE